MRIKTDNGKYETVVDNGRIEIYRYGELWRDATGDNYILSLLFKIDELGGDDASVRNNETA